MPLLVRGGAFRRGRRPGQEVLEEAQPLGFAPAIVEALTWVARARWEAAERYAALPSHDAESLREMQAWVDENQAP